MIPLVEHAADAPASPHDDLLSLARIMAVRALLLGVSLGAIFMTAVGTASRHDFNRWTALGCTTAGLMAGGALSLGVLCERRCHDARWRSALSAALRVTGIALVAGLLAVFEIAYVVAMARSGAPKDALESLADAWAALGARPMTYVGMALMLAPIFGVTTFARALRVQGPWWVLVAALAPLTSIPGIVLFEAHDRGGPLVFFGVAGCAVFVPLVAEAAERIEHDLRGVE